MKLVKPISTSDSTVANDSLNNLLPSQTSNSGKVLQTDGSNTSWQSVASLPTPYAEVPSGTVNSSNTAFTLAHTPASSASVMVILDGGLQYSGVDYTVSGSTITFTTAPTTGTSIFVYYNTVSGGGGGASAWGSITGTITDQTDLQTQFANEEAKAIAFAIALG